MKNIAVISLTNEHERRQHINCLFKENELEFDYSDAINKSQVVETLEKNDLTVNTDRMSLGEIGCFLSHYSLWKQVVEHEMPYLIIFEDDIFFAESAKVLLQELDWLPANFDVIKLETTYEEVMIKKEIDLSSSHFLFHMKSRHLGAGGYIISNKVAKQSIANLKKTGIEIPIDHLIFEQLVKENASNVYQIVPAICIQDIIYNKDSLSFTSSLEEERKPKSLVKNKLSAKQKVNRELTRLWYQTKFSEKYNSSLLMLKGYRSQIIEYRD